jgi:hypothetical protein
MPNWPKRKEAVQAQGCRCRRSEELPNHVAWSWLNPSGRIGLILDLIPPCSSKAGGAAPPHLHRADGGSQFLARKPRCPLLPSKFPISQGTQAGRTSPSQPHVFNAEGAAIAAARAAVVARGQGGLRWEGAFRAAQEGVTREGGEKLKTN